MIVKLPSIRFISLIAAIVFALPIPLGIWAGFYLWVSPLLFLDSALAVRTFVAFNFLGLIALALIVWKNRWFCRYLCPTGVLCDAVSKIGWKRKALQRIPALAAPLCLISLILAAFGVPVLSLLDPISLFSMFVDGLQAKEPVVLWFKITGLLFVLTLNVVIPHIWCQRVCPLGGLQDLCTEMRLTAREWKSTPKRRFNLKRRYLIAGAVGAGLGLIAQRLAHAQSRIVLRPPGALPESQFTTTCLRCGNCARACPTGVIKPSMDTSDWIRVLTPQIRFIDSYCLPECVNCGCVCPSGAIARYSLEEKKRLAIGVARIRIADCLLTHNRECDRCKTYCAYHAIEIGTPEDGFSSYPSVSKERCVGCGACQIVCPVEAIEIECG